jgi:5'-nucleotidase
VRASKTFPVLGALAIVIALGACSSSSKSSSSTTTSIQSSATDATSAPNGSQARALRVLVTNDDGVSAPGIDALVQALRAVPATTVTVVAPATNQSGSGSKTTGGTLTATDAKTASGYPAKAVKGYPADTIVWAIDQHGVADKPDVVFSGINYGQNIGKLIKISGTVGAARAAAQRGIPAVAFSAGFGANVDYKDAAKQAVTWLTQHRTDLLAGSSSPSVTNINVPSCPSGTPHPVVIVPVANASENPLATVDCTTTSTSKPTSDVNGFVNGYIVETDNLPNAA